MTRDPYVPFAISHCKRASRLEERFKQFNMDYFDSRLPDYQVLLCSKCKTFGHELSGYCVSNPRGGMILIRAGMGVMSTEQTLIHEMVHARLFWIKREIHGKRFISELRRLRSLGAPLSPRELDRAEKDSSLNREPLRATKKNVRKLVMEALTVEKLSEREIPRYLEGEFMLPFSVVNRLVSIKEEVRKVKSVDSCSQ
ncbi:MAG: hypothetical protein JRN15_05930 [Nitrososphaerota archaeon]|nr:hypothetical protein [Nitrososphaerota archaeon]